MERKQRVARIIFVYERYFQEIAHEQLLNEMAHKTDEELEDFYYETMDTAEEINSKHREG